MKIKFLLDYKGPETNWIAYTAGMIVLFPVAYGQRLISDGYAEAWVEPKPLKAKKPDNHEPKEAQ